jgi:hypothetical protein
VSIRSSAAHSDVEHFLKVTRCGELAIRRLQAPDRPSELLSDAADEASNNFPISFHHISGQ